MKILIVDDNVDFCSTVADVVRNQGWTPEVRHSPEDAINVLEHSASEIMLMLLDIEFGNNSKLSGIDVLSHSIRNFPSIPVIMISGKGTIETAVHATRLGAINFIEKSVLSNDRLVEVLGSALDRVRADSNSDELLRVIESHGIIGRSSAMMEVGDKIIRYGRTDLNVLITGETGTGKKLVAQALHAVSKRSKYPVITVDIPNIPRELFQSELFGHVKGAFSGAMENKRGLFHQAQKGTLFLDEIGDMPQDLQANLLLPTEQKSVRRVGSVETEEVDVRFVSATDRDLVSAMTEGRFREQLYHRLRECEIAIPALRDRAEDIPLIVDHYVVRHNKELAESRSVSPAAMNFLAGYEWPGNVRELSSVMRVVLQTSPAVILEVSDFHRMIKTAQPQSSLARSPRSIAPHKTEATKHVDEDQEVELTGSLKDDLARVDKLKIEQTLKRVSGNVSKAAATLGVSRETLHNKIRKYEIDVVSFRTR